MYKVVLFNDDYTPMDFVVEILEVFFNLNRELATKVMLAVHTEGRAVCGIYTRDIAETKAAQVNQYARESHGCVVIVEQNHLVHRWHLKRRLSLLHSQASGIVVIKTGLILIEC